MATLTTPYKILKVLMSNKVMGPKQIAMEIDREPGTVRNNLVHMKAQNLVKRVDYGKYEITELGRECYYRLSDPSNDPSSEESA